MKKVIAVLAGLLVTFVVVTIGTIASVNFFGDISQFSADVDGAKEMVRSLSTFGLILVIVTHGLGSFGGGATLGFIMKEDTMNMGLTLGAIMTILGMVNMTMIPTYPEWFYLDFLVFIPFSMLGAYLTSKL